MLATIKGPVARWSWVDRYGRPCELAQELAGSDAGDLTFAANQLDALLAAGAADQMAVSLEELGDPGLSPKKDAAQFVRVEEALAHCTEVGLDPWLLRRAVARRVVLSSGAALRDAGFRAAVLEAKLRGTPDAVDRWAGRAA
ncbi:hypothetical protein CLD22_25305 [Rubrivivax gelatinosus]|uniref:Uncharacterized protein n=1 Tax=Rubrivivax gelatinosus TaxID=28068 RepID=A0ABS1DWP1_RUBGE|nr:hypothetical protein [Rubrivivax gelatinosus]MBK1713177.1 hypothetical protein [Rubrivivax gelatinosus]MBZ8143174.1 hypothetical protein [Rubrivivax gelatinosus]